MCGICWKSFLLILSISFRLLVWSFHQKSVIHEIYMNYSRDKKPWFRWTARFLGNVTNLNLRNVPKNNNRDRVTEITSVIRISITRHQDLRGHAWIVCPWYFRTNLFEIRCTIQHIWERICSSFDSFYFISTRFTILDRDIWQIYYSGMVTFTITRPLVNLQESDDARLQKVTVRWLSGREIW